MRTLPGPVVGVDIGATKIAAATVTGAGVVQQRLIRPTPREGSAAVLQAVAELVAHLAAETSTDLAAVGVGAPGVIDPRDGSVVSATEILPGWAGTPVAAELERLTGLLVAVDNDVRVMARGELVRGAGRGAMDAVFVSVGTGVGGALARAGRVIRGAHYTAGELGHLLVPAEGVISCGCGRRDHLEAVASGPAIAAAYGARTATPAVALPEVVLRMADGNAIALDVVTSAAGWLGRALAGLLGAVDAEVVVVGGGVAQIGTAFIDPLTAALRAEVLPPLRGVPVRVAELGTDAPLVGAAALAEDAIADRAGLQA